MKKASKRKTKAKAKPKAVRETMRAEYDFSGGVRGKYVGRAGGDTVMVALDPDVAAVFGTSAAVNRALRAMLDTVPIARQRRGRPAN